jgi:hypothetical protein
MDGKIFPIPLSFIPVTIIAIWMWLYLQHPLTKVLIISECWQLKITGLITGSNDSL